MLRFVNLEALSSMPTWSTLGDKVKSGKRLKVFSTIDLFVIFKITTIVLHECQMQGGTYETINIFKDSV
jgi:hypothetical protein